MMVHHIPGGEFVRRHSVCVDIAWILYGRQRQGFDGPIDAADGVGGVSRWSWADSSPQAQHDWFQTKEAWAFVKCAVSKTSSQCPPLGVGWGHVPPSQRSTPWTLPAGVIAPHRSLFSLLGGGGKGKDCEFGCVLMFCDP